MEKLLNELMNTSCKKVMKKQLAKIGKTDR